MIKLVFAIVLGAAVLVVATALAFALATLVLAVIG